MSLSVYGAEVRSKAQQNQEASEALAVALQVHWHILRLVLRHQG